MMLSPTSTCATVLSQGKWLFSVGLLIWIPPSPATAPVAASIMW